MLLIPKAAYAGYLGYLKKCSIDEALFPEYVKWLRYYLDFCGKYLIKGCNCECGILILTRRC